MASSTPRANSSKRRDGPAKKVPAKDAGTNGNVTGDGELAQEKDAAAADVADDSKKASIEDEKLDRVVDT